jgi:hypothetical protein
MTTYTRIGLASLSLSLVIAEGALARLAQLCALNPLLTPRHGGRRRHHCAIAKPSLPSIMRSDGVTAPS